MVGTLQLKKPLKRIAVEQDHDFTPGPSRKSVPDCLSAWRQRRQASSLIFIFNPPKIAVRALSCLRSHFSFSLLLLIIKHLLALFGENCYLPLPKLMLSGGGHGFAPALSLQTLELIHGAIKLPVQVSFVAEQFVRCIRGGGEWCKPFGEFSQRGPEHWGA